MTLDGLPVSDAIRPRPLAARVLRILNGEKWTPPTEAEVRDAIQVLAETLDDDADFGDQIHCEATAILEANGGVHVDQLALGE